MNSPDVSFRAQLECVCDKCVSVTVYIFNKQAFLFILKEKIKIDLAQIKHEQESGTSWVNTPTLTQSCWRHFSSQQWNTGMTQTNTSNSSQRQMSSYLLPECHSNWLVGSGFDFIFYCWETLTAIFKGLRINYSTMIKDIINLVKHLLSLKGAFALK